MLRILLLGVLLVLEASGTYRKSGYGYGPTIHVKIVRPFGGKYYTTKKHSGKVELKKSGKKEGKVEVKKMEVEKEAEKLKGKEEEMMVKEKEMMKAKAMEKEVKEKEEVKEKVEEVKEKVEEKKMETKVIEQKVEEEVKEQVIEEEVEEEEEEEEVVVVAGTCDVSPCEPGDKQDCFKPGFEFQSRSPPISDCCNDDYCSVCHSNGCNQCCDDSFKIDNSLPCIPRPCFDPNCKLVQNFDGCGQCTSGLRTRATIQELIDLGFLSTDFIPSIPQGLETKQIFYCKV